MDDGGLTEAEADKAAEYANRASTLLFNDLEDAADEDGLDLGTAALGVFINLIWYLCGQGWNGDELIEIVREHSAKCRNMEMN